MPVMDNAIRVLLVSSDLNTLNSICAMTQKLAIRCEPCPSSDLALKKLTREKFEGIMVDFNCADEHFVEFLHTSSSHCKAVTFAIVGDTEQTRAGTHSGVTFMIARPLEDAAVQRVLRAALALLFRERRRYFRCPIRIPVVLVWTGGNRLAAQSINISEGGMALSVDTQVAVGVHLELHFELPGAEQPLRMRVDVCWAKGNTLGVQFVNVPCSIRAQVQSWLSERVQHSLPLAQAAP